MTQIRLPITEQSQPSAARRMAIELAKKAGLDESEIGNIALLVTELGTNLVKHAQNGELLLRDVGEQGGRGVEVLSLDRGPGMRDVTKSLTDGFSTAGSSGTGLGSVMRSAGTFDIYSQPGKGTAIVARVSSKNARPPAQGAVSVGVVHQAKQGETLCGDDWIVRHFTDGWLCAVVDGLGHGLVAAEAARPIIEAVRTAQGRKTPVELVEMAHQASRTTRGAALAVAVMDEKAKVVRFAGIGNIAGMILDGSRQRHLVSLTGIVGHQYQKVVEFSYPWPTDGIFLLHSDGIGNQWDLLAYPGLSSRDASLVAAVLYRDHARGRDDATMVVVKAGEPIRRHDLTQPVTDKDQFKQWPIA
ncbi:putative anti-sigma regulatory factor, serine/threonine protein kinase [Nitrospira sp. KM1]|uniref:ATP-binding SpoIIE family protein phosphatase n=1 Tax=Nitrospira sp. KM1 TaxID=1936990 RepID=UPI0013A72447|nr:ATP-binding SpoIIE family protein phosphatase [Nitrospira sp. KM1]BCA53327.1 putative anti-sigma regulatory factor, serine/threonine protein kinase [Nitrospira sp. KM1]